MFPQGEAVAKLALEFGASLRDEVVTGVGAAILLRALGLARASMRLRFTCCTTRWAISTSEWREPRERLSMAWR